MLKGPPETPDPELNCRTLDRVATRFPRANPNDLFDRAHEDFAVPDSAGLGRADYGLDRAFHDAYRAGVPLPAGPLDLVVTETPPNGSRFVAPEGGTRVLRIGPEVAPEDAHGEFIGMALFSQKGAAALRAVDAGLAAARAEGLERASVTHILQAMIDRRHPIVAVEIHKGWMEIDTIEDYRRACAELAR